VKIFLSSFALGGTCPLPPSSYAPKAKHTSDLLTFNLPHVRPVWSQLTKHIAPEASHHAVNGRDLKLVRSLAVIQSRTVAERLGLQQQNDQMVIKSSLDCYSLYGGGRAGGPSIVGTNV